MNSMNKGQKLSKQQRQLQNKQKKVKAVYDLTQRVNENGEIELVLVPKLLYGQKQQDLDHEEIVLGPSYVPAQPQEEQEEEHKDDYIFGIQDDQPMIAGDELDDVEAALVKQLIMNECQAGVEAIEVAKQENEVQNNNDQIKLQLIKETNFVVDNGLEAQLEEEFKLFMAEGGADAYVQKFSKQNKYLTKLQTPEKQYVNKENEMMDDSYYSYNYDSDMEIEEMEIDEDVDDEFGFDDYFSSMKNSQDNKMSDDAKIFLEQQLFGASKTNQKESKQQQKLTDKYETAEEFELAKAKQETEEEKAANDFFTSSFAPNDPNNMQLTSGDMRLLQQLKSSFIPSQGQQNYEEDDELIPESKYGDYNTYENGQECSQGSDMFDYEEDMPQFKSRQHKEYDVIEKKLDQKTDADLLQNQATKEDIAWQLEQLKLMEERHQETEDPHDVYVQNLQLHNQANYQLQHPNSRYNDQEINKYVPVQIGYTGVPLGVFSSKKKDKQEEKDSTSEEENYYQKITFSHEKKRGLSAEERKLRKKVISEAKKQKRDQKRQLKQQFEHERIRLQKAHFREQHNIQGKPE